MNIEFIKLLLRRTKRYSWIILAIGILLGSAFYYVARQSVVLYSSFTSLFPLSNNSNNNINSSAISSLLGVSDISQAFGGSEASVNIIELATSRTIREEVAKAAIPFMHNKTIAQLLIEENNRHTGFLQKKAIKMPENNQQIINIASDLIKKSLNAKINKNGVLELRFTNTSPTLVKEISYLYVSKISEFYINLKKKKAEIDFDFAVKKADSLLAVLNKMDKRAIELEENNFFTNQTLKRYSLPQTNLAQDKAAIQSQYYLAVGNRESAAYRLQKETPIVEILDRPEPPYEITKKSKLIYTALGIILGIIFGFLVVNFKVIIRFIFSQLNKQDEKTVIQPVISS